MLSTLCLCFLSVNNAGVGLLGPVESISIDEMKRVFETNFFGVVRMIKEVMPDMKKRRAGHIVVMSSVMGLQGMICVFLIIQNNICCPVQFVCFTVHIFGPDLSLALG